MGPLDDIRVLEIGTLLAGPFTGRLLGDFGADVIKIEPPDKEDTLRKWGERVEDQGLLWPVQSRNKKSITLNLREPEGQELFLELVKTADVVLENFRPGTLEKWGLGYETLKRENEKIILLRTSGFGQTGPYSSRAGFGSVGEAMGGLRYVTGYPDRPPTRIGISIGDELAGVFATIGCLVALHERERSGIGQVVDTAIYEAVFAMMEGIVPEYDLKGHIRERAGNTIPGVAPSNIYETKDGFIVMGANADNVFKRLCQVMDQPHLAIEGKFSTHILRGENQEELDQLINEWSKTWCSEPLLERLNENGIPAGKIYNAKDIVEDLHYQAREMILKMTHPTLGEIKLPGIVPKLSRTPGEVRSLGSIKLGEHNSDIYTEVLGLSKEKLEQLKRNHII